MSFFSNLSTLFSAEDEAKRKAKISFPRAQQPQAKPVKQFNKPVKQAKPTPVMQAEASSIIEKAKQEAESLIRDAHSKAREIIVEAKDESLEIRSKIEKETRRVEQELANQQRELQNKLDKIDFRFEQTAQKEERIDQLKK
ncbi:MAG: hypothetical protein US20_C0010G0024, partial [Candidatus Pacebacteria bacterium GW2011_GWF1_36_5]